MGPRPRRLEGGGTAVNGPPGGGCAVPAASPPGAVSVGSPGRAEGASPPPAGGRGRFPPSPHRRGSLPAAVTPNDPQEPSAARSPGAAAANPPTPAPSPGQPPPAEGATAGGVSRHGARGKRSLGARRVEIKLHFRGKERGREARRGRLASGSPPHPPPPKPGRAAGARPPPRPRI